MTDAPLIDIPPGSESALLKRLKEGRMPRMIMMRGRFFLVMTPCEFGSYMMGYSEQTRVDAGQPCLTSASYAALLFPAEAMLIRGAASQGMLRIVVVPSIDDYLDHNWPADRAPEPANAQ